MSLRSALIAALALTGLVGCGDMNGEGDAIEVPDQPAPVSRSPDQAEPAATVPFEAREADNVTGLLRLYPGEGDGFELDVMLEGLAAGEYAWHIHHGSCDAPGAVAVALSASGDSDGIAGRLIVPEEDEPALGSAIVRELTLEEATGGEYTLHVRAAGRMASGPTLACADLGRRDDPTM
jgi:hypothetical protein